MSRSEVVLSQWVSLVEKGVESTPGQPPQTYHSLAQADYVTVVARTPSGLIPIVRQFRAAISGSTWEFPAGLLETGETPEVCCQRELLEEAGLSAMAVHPLGAFHPDTGRLENRIHLFAVEASEPHSDFVEEPGVSVAYVTARELRERIMDGSFAHQMHIGALAVASIKGFDLGVWRS